MLVAVLVAALQTLEAPPEPVKGQVQSAIWADLQTNAMIGNGNWLASLWYQAGSDTAPNLHIQHLACAKTRSGQRCSFVLHRDGGPITILNETAPDNLACVADFTEAKGEWSIVHTPPRKTGHSKTSMRCKAEA
jgi:hypothetical protein